MTAATADETPTDTLGTYEGFDVSGATVSIRNAGDGLSQALEVEAVKLDLHSTVHVVLECEVTKHTYEEIKDDPDALILVNVLKAGRATLIDRDTVASALDEQTRKIEEAKAEAERDKRQMSLDDVDEDDIVDAEIIDDPADPVEVLEQAEVDQFRRRRRTAELDAKSKPELEDMARDLGLSLTGRPTKSELVDLIVDEQEARA